MGKTLYGLLYAVGFAGGFSLLFVLCDGVFQLCYKKIPAFHSAVDRFIDSTLD